MAPITVAHLIPTLSSGGAERQLVNVVRTTSPERFNHIVCVIGEADFYEPYIREAGHRVIRLGISEHRPFLKAARRFRKVISDEKPDIVHTWLYDANISGRLASILRGRIPLVTSLQLADYDPDGIRAAGWNTAKVFGLKMIDRITASLTRPFMVPCSEFVRDSYQQNFGLDESRTTTIYNAVEAKVLTVADGATERLRAELRLPNEAFVYLNVGRLDPQKNHKAILEAFKLTIADVPSAFLLLAGVGGIEEKLKLRAVQLDIADRVIFLGRRNDVGALLELADVFVFPSLLEGLPVALVEAMFKSVPCIASRIKVFEEVVTDGETGILVDPHSPDELAQAMVKLSQDSGLRTRLGENAFRHASSTFNASVIAKQWEALYLRLV